MIAAAAVSTTMLAASAAPAQGADAIGFYPLGLDFGSQTVGTSTSRDIGFEVSCEDNPCTTSFTTLIKTTTGFTQTNNCPAVMTPTLANAVQCTITVTYTPLAVGSWVGVLLASNRGPAADLAGAGLAVPAPSTSTPPPTSDGTGGRKCKRKRASAGAAKKKCRKKKR